MRFGRQMVVLDPVEVWRVDEHLRKMDDRWHTDNPNTERMGLPGRVARRRGLLAEIATAVHYKAEWDPPLGPDEGYDVETKALGLVNVKAVPWKQREDPHLKVEDARRKGCDAYLLAVVGEGDLRVMVELVGWCEAQRLESAPHRNYGHGPCRALTEAELRPIL